MIAYLGLRLAVMTPLPASLASRPESVDPHSKTTGLGLAVGFGALASIVSGLVFGVLGDSTAARLGRRKPWTLAGLPVLLAGSVVAGPGSTVSSVMAGFVLSRPGLSAIVTAVQAILPDQVPEQQRGKVSGLLGLTTQIAGVTGFQLASPLKGSGLLLFLVPAAAACLALLPVVLFLPDRAKGLAAGAFAVGFTVVATASSFLQVFVGSQIVLLGAGTFGAVGIALVADVIPNKEAEGAEYMSVFCIAGALPLRPIHGVR